MDLHDPTGGLADTIAVLASRHELADRATGCFLHRDAFSLGTIAECFLFGFGESQCHRHAESVSERHHWVTGRFRAVDMHLDLSRAAPLPEQSAGSRAASAVWRARDSRIVTSTDVDDGRFASYVACVDIEASARKHDVDDYDMVHALRHHWRAFETDDGAVTMFIGPSTNAQPFDFGLTFSARLRNR